MTPRKLSIHHLGIAVVDIESALGFYQTALGFTLVSKVIFDPTQKVKICFLANEPNRILTLELISPVGCTSPVNGYLSKGIGAYHVCYEVKQLEKALEGLRAKGCVLIAPPVAAVAFDGRRIAWCLTPTRHLVEFVELELPSRGG